MSNVPGTEDRIWAVISHLSALAFGVGIVLPVIGWWDQRRKSNFASFQCLQALGYQSLGFTVSGLSSLVAIALAFAILLAGLNTGGANGAGLNAAGRLWLMVVALVMLGLFLMYFLLPIVGAVACAFGRNFSYPILGDRLARYLRYDSRPRPGSELWWDEDREFRWVAAMGHFSILIAVWSMLVPLAVWILAGKSNRWLKLQSIQTLIYQALANILYLGASFLVLFGAFLLAAGISVRRTPDVGSGVEIAMLAILGLVLWISLVLMLTLLVPFLHILGQWAGYRVLKGEDYHYPLIGRLVSERIPEREP